MRSFHGWIYNESKEWEKLSAGDGKARSVSPVLSFSLLRKCSCERDIFQVVSLLCSGCCIVPGRIDMISLDGFFFRSEMFVVVFWGQSAVAALTHPHSPSHLQPSSLFKLDSGIPFCAKGISSCLPIVRPLSSDASVSLTNWGEKKTLDSLNEHVCVDNVDYFMLIE